MSEREDDGDAIPVPVIDLRRERMRRGLPVKVTPLEPSPDWAPTALLEAAGIDTSTIGSPLLIQGGTCKHASVEVDADERTVYCVICKSRLDAVAVLLDFAHKDRAFLHDLKVAQQQHARFLAEVGKLSAEVDNLKKRRSQASRGDLAAMRKERDDFKHCYEENQKHHLAMTEQNRKLRRQLKKLKVEPCC